MLDPSAMDYDVYFVAVLSADSVHDREDIGAVVQVAGVGMALTTEGEDCGLRGGYGWVGGTPDEEDYVGSSGGSVEGVVLLVN